MNWFNSEISSLHCIYELVTNKKFVTIDKTSTFAAAIVGWLHIKT